MDTRGTFYRETFLSLMHLVTFKRVFLRVLLFPAIIHREHLIHSLVNMNGFTREKKWMYLEESFIYRFVWSVLVH